MKKRIMLFYLLMLAMFGCKKDVVDIVDPVDNIEPQTNADGNYYHQAYQPLPTAIFYVRSLTAGEVEM